MSIDQTTVEVTTPEDDYNIRRVSAVIPCPVQPDAPPPDAPALTYARARLWLYRCTALCYLAMRGTECIGAVVSKLEHNKRGVLRGYIAMLAVRRARRKSGLGTRLVRATITAMAARRCDEVVLEAETSNAAALRLYHNLGFIRDKRLEKYYLNGNDAFRLKLRLSSIPPPAFRLPVAPAARPHTAHTERAGRTAHAPRGCTNLQSVRLRATATYTVAFLDVRLIIAIRFVNVSIIPQILSGRYANFFECAETIVSALDLRSDLRAIRARPTLSMSCTVLFGSAAVVGTADEDEPAAAGAAAAGTRMSPQIRPPASVDMTAMLTSLSNIASRR
eukprot:IDg8578t1